MCSRILQRFVLSVLAISICVGPPGRWPLASGHAVAQRPEVPADAAPALDRRFEELKELETSVILSMLEEIGQGMQRVTECVGDMDTLDRRYLERRRSCSGMHRSMTWRDFGPLIWVLTERRVEEAVPLLAEIYRTPGSAWNDDLLIVASRFEIANAWLELGRPDLRGIRGIRFARKAIVAGDRSSLEHRAASLVLAREKEERGWSPELRALLDDSDWRVRREALLLIGIQGAHEPWEQKRVIDALMDPEEFVREIAAARLSNPYGDDSWVEVGIASLERDDLTEFARESIHRALSRRGLEARRTPQGWEVHQRPEREGE